MSDSARGIKFARCLLTEVQPEIGTFGDRAEKAVGAAGGYMGWCSGYLRAGYIFGGAHMTHIHVPHTCYASSSSDRLVWF